jgi:hypothetical protein
MLEISQRLKRAPPRKSHQAAMSQWKDWMAEHIDAHLLRYRWELRRKPAPEIGAGMIMPKRDEDASG